MAEPTVGFFKWQCQHGRAYPSKYIVEGASTMKDTAAYWDFLEVVKWPLGATEFAMDLDILAARYPLPADYLDIIERKRDPSTR